MSYCHIDISHRDLTDEVKFIWRKKQQTNKQTKNNKTSRWI